MDDSEDLLSGELQQKAFELSWWLVDILRMVKDDVTHSGIRWAIAATDAEKLHAWISYAIGTVDTTDE